MSEVFLGIIAVAVMVMAIIQVAAIVFAARAARRVSEAVAKFERDLQPILANLQSLTAEATRATAVAAAQVDRAEHAFTDLAHRVDEILALVRHNIIAPAQEGFAIFHTLKAVFDAWRGGFRDSRRRPTAAEEEDALFIG